MNELDLSSLPPGISIYVTGAIAVALGALTFVERAAKIKGPLGSLARWWNERQIREVTRRATLNERIESLVDDRVKSETKGLRDAVESLRRQVGELQKDQAATARDRDLWADYAAELTAILYRTRQWAAEKGLELPERIPRFHEFRDRVED